MKEAHVSLLIPFILENARPVRRQKFEPKYNGCNVFRRTFFKRGNVIYLTKPGSSC